MRALVLSGGGVKGAYQVGVLRRWMREEQVDYDIMCGISVGALNIAMLGMTPKGLPDEASLRLEETWTNRVKQDAIFRRWFPFGRLHGLVKKSVYDSSPLVNLINEFVDNDILSKNGRQLAVGAVSLDTGKSFYAYEDNSNFNSWVAASSAVPVLFEPIEIDGRLWSDGGLRLAAPVGRAIRLGATHIDLIVCSPRELSVDSSDTGWRAIPDQVQRSIDIAYDQVLRSDVRIMLLKNEMAKYDSRFRKVTVRIVQPQKKLVDSSFDFSPLTVARLIDVGYADSKNAITWL